MSTERRKSNPPEPRRAGQGGDNSHGDAGHQRHDERSATLSLAPVRQFLRRATSDFASPGSDHTIEYAPAVPDLA